jgi:hypothetical protein
MSFENVEDLGKWKIEILEVKISDKLLEFSNFQFHF